jgi:GGDEF domain-containing protein
MSTALTIYQAAREIEKLEPSDVLKGMADVVRAVMKPEKFSIYLMKENALELVVFEGWSGNDRYARAFSSGSPLFHGVIGERRYPCAADKTDEKILLGEGLLAGPLLSRESGEVFGMLKVEELGFLRLNITSVQTFKAVCQWLGTAYSNARLHEAAQSDSITNRETQLFSHGFFRQYTAHLAELARRIGFDLSMIILRLDNETELTDGQRSLIPPALSKAIQISLRRTDLAFEHRRGSCEYAVVLPNTPQMNCAFVAEKLVKTLRACLGDEAGRARFSTSVHSLNRGTQGEALRICELVPRQVDFMVQLARRLGFDLAAIDMRLAHAEELPLEGRNALHGAVYSVFESLLPPDGSLVASYPAGSGYQILLFPMTTQEASAAILPLSQAVEAKVKTLGVQAHFTYAAQSLHARRESESAHV